MPRTDLADAVDRAVDDVGVEPRDGLERLAAGAAHEPADRLVVVPGLGEDSGSTP